MTLIATRIFPDAENPLALAFDDTGGSRRNHIKKRAASFDAALKIVEKKRSS
jgi:hypothetical protein